MNAATHRRLDNVFPDLVLVGCHFCENTGLTSAESWTVCLTLFRECSGFTKDQRIFTPKSVWPGMAMNHRN